MGHRVGVIGSGSYGCVLANVLRKNGHDVKIWSFSEEEKNKINNEHTCVYLKDSKLDENIVCTTSLEEAVKGTDYLFIVTPSFAVRNTCRELSKYVTNQDIVVASKGLEGHKVLTQVVDEEINKDHKKTTIQVISGPSHAEQIYKGVPTFFDYNGYVDLDILLSNDDIILKSCDDPIGMQLGAALKNIIAISIGEVIGMYYKNETDFDKMKPSTCSNAVSAFVTQGLNEMKIIGTSLGAKESTFNGYSGIGDLITTSLSLDSRNLKCGVRLGQGKSLEEIKNEIGMTIEGLNALDSAMEIINEKNLNCPMVKRLYEKIHKDEIFNDNKSLHKTF